jgi:hypothetical protein
MTRGQALEVRRDDFTAVRIADNDVPSPGAGEVVFEVLRFGFSANNVTYGRLGEALGYWRLFPAADGWGRLPVWGYLRVAASATPEIAEGRLAYGLCPMSTHVVLTPDRVTSAGFVDAGPHRAGLSPTYNAYSWLDTDPAHVRALADHLLVLRPVFWLSFLVDDYLARLGYLADSAVHVLVTSGSSRAAIGLTHLLSRRGVPTIGLTAVARCAALEELGSYTEVYSYEDLILRPVRTVLVDLAGGSTLRDRVAAQLGSALVHTAVAGFTHGSGLPSAATAFLFVPDLIVERARAEGWHELNARYVVQLRGFAESSTAWLTISHSQGPAEVEAAYRRVLDNRGAATDAHVLTLAEFR